MSPQRGPISVQVADQRGVADYQLVFADHDVTLAEVFDALDLPPTAAVDGAVPRDAANIRAVEALAPGSRLGPTGSAGDQAAPATPALVEVAVVAGPDCGSVAQLPTGRYRIGATPGDPRSGWYVAIDHPTLASTRSKPWHERAQTVEAIEFDNAVLALSKPVDAEEGAPGYLHRPPRPMPPEMVEPIEVLPPPKPVAEPQPLSWATLLAPIPIALLMAFFFRPLFAVFAAMGPVVALGRWFEGRRKFKKDTAKREAEIAAMQADVRSALIIQAEAQAELRWLNNPHVGELWRRSRAASVRIWERRPNSPGYLTVTVGVAPDAVEPWTDDAKLSPEIHAALAAPIGLRSVPHVVDLAQHLGLGIHGSRDRAVALARSIVLQLATLHGPADLRIGLVCSEENTSDWDWVKWLPHVSNKLVANSAVPLVRELQPPPGMSRAAAFTSESSLGSVELILVDDPTADVAAIHRVAVEAERDVRFIALADHPTLLPAACSSLVAVAGAAAEISTPELQGRRTLVCASAITAHTAVSWARALAPLRDPELTDFEVGGDDAVSLLQLVGFESTEALTARWDQRAPDAAPVATVGVGDSGPFSLDLTEDGPHMLVAGTTGSGKSEFLRTFVVALAAACPPEQLNFVLVDFKGGGAFDICDRLPHIAGLITDLDEQLVVRAINSLRAELHRREHLFRDLGVSSYDEAARIAPEPVARLVIVVDEFAALATDYAELMTSIIDLAARGRSLGMHLVLATQRPSGVVDQKIRANTNLRVALRVQDSYDSQDVIGVPDAARIDRKSPGRAIFSIGGDTPVTVQTAYSGAPDLRGQRCTINPMALFDHDAVPRTAPESSATAVTEIAVLTEAIAAASEARAYTPRPLWPDPLPDSLDWIDLGTRVLSAPAGVAVPGNSTSGLPIGLVDLPDMQAQLPWRWDPDSGPLMLVGSSADCAGKALVAIGAGFISAGSAAENHLYLIDGDAGGIAPLAGSAHTGAYVTVNELDRLDRTILFFERSLAARRIDTTDAELPRLVLLIDNLASVLGAYDDMAAGAFVERLSALARDGGPQRIHLVIAARTVRDVSHRLAQQFPNRLVLGLADPNGYLTLGLKNREVVPLPAMRAIELTGKRVLQLVEPPELSTVANDVAIPAGQGPAGIGTFPTFLAIDELPVPVVHDGALGIPIGVEAGDLQVAALLLQPNEHALVVSGPGGGRSTTLLTIAAQLARAGMEGQLYRIATAGSPLLSDELPGELVDSVEGVEVLATVAGGVVLVDDADRLGDDMCQALEALSRDPLASVRIIAAATPDFARGLRSWTSKIRTGGTGIMLGGNPTDGDLLKAKLTKLAGLSTILGRGHLVIRGRAQPVQIAVPAAAHSVS